MELGLKEGCAVVLYEGNIPRLRSRTRTDDLALSGVYYFFSILFSLWHFMARACWGHASTFFGD